MAINASGLRTVLKKDLLKFRFKELICQGGVSSQATAVALGTVSPLTGDQQQKIDNFSGFIDGIALCEKKYRREARRNVSGKTG